MTNSQRRSRPARRPVPKIRPSQIVTVILVLAAFTAGVVIGGSVGGLIVGLLSVAAGALLAMRWSALDPRIRVFRALVVLIGLAIAVSLYLR